MAAATVRRHTKPRATATSASSNSKHGASVSASATSANGKGSVRWAAPDWDRMPPSVARLAETYDSTANRLNRRSRVLLDELRNVSDGRRQHAFEEQLTELRAHRFRVQPVRLGVARSHQWQRPSPARDQPYEVRRQPLGCQSARLRARLCLTASSLAAADLSD